MENSPRFWRSIHGSGPYEANRMLAESWVIGISIRERSRLGIYESEAEAIDRAIRDNQRLTRAIKAQITSLKDRRAALKAARPAAAR